MMEWRIAETTFSAAKGPKTMRFLVKTVAITVLIALQFQLSATSAPLLPLSLAPVGFKNHTGKDGIEKVEEFVFWIKDFKMNHQSEVNNVNITIRYQYVSGLNADDYPDFRPIARDVEELLAHYPNKHEYWEEVNKKIALMIFKKYATLARITSEILVSPSAADPYSRMSIITLIRKNRIGTKANKKPFK